MPVEITPRKARDNDCGEQTPSMSGNHQKMVQGVDDDLQAGVTDGKYLILRYQGPVADRSGKRPFVRLPADPTRGRGRRRYSHLM